MSTIPVTVIALSVLCRWYEGFDKYRNSKSSMERRTGLRWKAIGIVQHDRILNNEPAPPIPMRTMAQVIGK